MAKEASEKRSHSFQLTPDTYPEKIIGLVNHGSETYALTQWHSLGRAYCPYEFIKKHFQKLLIDFFTEKSGFITYRTESDVKEVKRQRKKLEEEKKKRPKPEKKKTKRSRIKFLEDDTDDTEQGVGK